MKEDIVEEGILEEQDFDIMSMEWLIEGIWNRSSWEGNERWYWIEEEGEREESGRKNTWIRTRREIKRRSK